MTEVDFQERITVEFQSLTTALNCRLDALDQIAASLDSIAHYLEVVASLYEHEHRI